MCGLAAAVAITLISHTRDDNRIERRCADAHRAGSGDQTIVAAGIRPTGPEKAREILRRVWPRLRQRPRQ